MSLLSDLQTIAEHCGVPVETGVFSGKAPDTYLVITPLSDSFELHADNAPGCETQEARLSLFTKGSYTKLKNALVRALLCICKMKVDTHKSVGVYFFRSIMNMERK